MKKLSIILLALAFALVMTVPALAIHIGSEGTSDGSLGITGTYQFDGQVDDDDNGKNEYWDDDLEVGVALGNDAVQRLCEEVAMVVTWHDDGYPRPCLVVVCMPRAGARRYRARLVLHFQPCATWQEHAPDPSGE